MTASEVDPGEANPNTSLPARLATAIRTRRTDILALAVLIAIPALYIGITAAMGHPLLPGDDWRQGLPLRVLAGHDLAGGHLPLWNPYIWSGTPLLGGWNAGALYPTVALFAFLPAVGAWTLSLIITYAVCSSGTYLLARKLHLRPMASFLAAATFSYFGAMSNQVFHVELVDGYAWIPWFVLAVEGLAAALRSSPGAAGWDSMEQSTWRWQARRRQAGWVALGALAAGMADLSGSPDAVEKLFVIGGLVTLWHALSNSDLPGWRTRGLLVALVTLAFVWGATVGAVQLLPGLSFQTISQTTDGSLIYSFAFISLPFWAWLLMLIPGITGGAGTFSMPLSPQPIPEFSGYAGLLPLAALGALATRSYGRRRKDPLAGRWRMWIVVAVVGAILAMAPELPGLSALAHVPVYGSLRAQARNLLIVDLALAMILGYFADRVLFLARPRQAAGETAEEPEQVPGGTGTPAQARPPIDRIEVAGAVLPMACVIAFFVVALAFPKPVEAALGLPENLGNLVCYMLPLIAFSVILAIEISAFAATLPRLGQRAISTLMVCTVIADAVLFSAGISQFGANLTPATLPVAGAQAGSRSLLLQGLGTSPGGTGGRVAFFDPSPFNSAGSPSLGTASIEADTNIYASVPSVQGYGALVWKRYDAATCTHELGDMRVSALASPTFAVLNLRTLIVAKGAFTSPTQSSITRAPLSLPFAPGSWGVCPPSAYAPATGGGVSRKGAPGSSWFIGSPKQVSKVFLNIPSAVSEPKHGSGPGPGPRSGSVLAQRSGSELVPGSEQGQRSEARQASPGMTQVGRDQPAQSAQAPDVQLLAPVGTTGRLATIATSPAVPVPPASQAAPAGHGAGQEAARVLQYVATFPRAPSAVALRMAGTGVLSVSPSQVVIEASSGSMAQLDGPLASEVLPGHWAYLRTIGSEEEFTDVAAWGHLRFIPTGPAPEGAGSHGASTPNGPAYRVVRANADGTETDQVATPTKALLVRSEAWAPGWTATIASHDGKNTVDPVLRYGIVQAITLPPGTYSVTFTYWPPGMTGGISLSAAGAIVLAATAAALLATCIQPPKRRRRSSPEEREHT